MLVAKPGLDGHSNGAEQIAVAARDAGMEVVYSGIRMSPEQIAASARDEDPDVIGLSILSGSYLLLVQDVLDHLRKEGVDAPVVVGGIIPEDDRSALLEQGVAAVYTPKDFELGRIMTDIATIAEQYQARRWTTAQSRPRRSDTRNGRNSLADTAGDRRILLHDSWAAASSSASKIATPVFTDLKVGPTRIMTPSFVRRCSRSKCADHTVASSSVIVARRSPGAHG